MFMAREHVPSPFRPATVRLIARLVAPLTDSGLVWTSEYDQLVDAMRALAKRDGFIGGIPPRLIDGKTAAEMLGISYSQFRALEAEGAFLPTIRRRTIGSPKTVRYLNLEILRYMGINEIG